MSSNRGWRRALEDACEASARLNGTTLVLFSTSRAVVDGPSRSSGSSATGDSAESAGGGQSGSGRLPFVSVMKPAQLRDRDDAAIVWRRDRAMDGRVLVQRQVRARLFVIRTIERHQSMQAGFVEHDHVLTTVAARGSNESLAECILPRCARCRKDFLHSHGFRRNPDVIERVIAIVQQVARRVVPRKRLA